MQSREPRPRRDRGARGTRSLRSALVAFAAMGCAVFLAQWPIQRGLAPAPVVEEDLAMSSSTARGPSDPSRSVVSAMPAAVAAAAPLTRWLPAYLPRLEAAPRPSFEHVSQLGGVTRDVALRGRTAFVAVGSRIYAFDLRDPDEPVEIGRSPMLPRVVEDIELAGELAWLAVGGAGLLALDVSDPTHMKVAGRFDTRGHSLSVAVQEDLALLADKKHMLVLDVGDPMAVRELGRWPAPHKVEHVELEGRTAYAGDEREGLFVFDVSDPVRFEIVEVVDFGCNSHRTLAYGPVAFLITGCGDFVLDVRDPDHVVELGRLEPAGGYGTLAMTLMGDLLLASNTLFDLSDPFTPRRVAALPGRADDAGPLWGARAAADEGLVIGTTWGEAGFLVADLRDLDAPRLAGSWSTLGGLWWDRLFGLPDEPALALGNRRVDVSDPRRPRIDGEHALATGSPDWSPPLLVEDGWGLVVGDQSGVRRSSPLDLVELGPPRNVRPIPTHPGPWGGFWHPESAAKVDNVVWLAGSIWGGCPAVLALDLEDRATPRWRGTLDDLRANVVSIAADAATSSILLGQNDGHCSTYLVDGPGMLTVLDASDPDHPTVTARLETPGIVHDIVTWQGTAFAAADRGGLRVIDLQGPGAPREIASLDGSDERARALALDWPYLWLGYSKNLRLIDIREPARPREIMRRDVPNELVAMELHHGTLWLATEEAGLLGFRARP